MKQYPVLNISQFPANKEKDFYANDFANHIKAHHSHISKPHKHDFYLSLLFTQGNGIHEVDFRQYTIKKGAAFMLNPGQTHHWEFSADTQGYIILHSRVFYELPFTQRTLDSFPFFYSLQSSPCLYLQPEQLGSISQLFETILAEYYAAHVLKYQKISSLLDLLYIELSRAYLGQYQAAAPGTPDLYLEKVRKLERLIDQHYLTHKSAGAYAEMMHMSTRHLNRITQAVLGKTTTDLIAERVLLEAQRMLSQAQVSVAAVADALGFEDHSYFSRLFRKKLQIAPSEFAARYY